MSTEAVNPSPANPNITKVFIGNLAFATREEALRNAFEALNIKLHSVNVVVKRGRSMGYGFVEIDDSDYPTAFEKLHKSTLDSRTINLEKATSTNSNKQTKKPRKPRQNKKKAPAKGGAPVNNNAAAPKQATEQPATQGDKPAATENKKKRNTKRKKKTTNPAAGGAKPTEGKPEVVESGSGAPAAAPAAKKAKAKKPKAAPAANQKREHSGTELYVANIPFTLTDDELKQEFAQFGCVSATVIINSFGKNKGKSNRGYGFVKVDTEDNQKAAIEQDKKLKIGGRDISIKPAFVRTEPVKPDEASKESEAKADAPKEAPKADAPKTEEVKKE